MWTSVPVVREDLENLTEKTAIPWERLRNKTVLVTGATGLIGSSLVNGLLYAGEKKHLNLTVLALVRSEEKARTLFAEQLAEQLPLCFAEGSVETMPAINVPVHYIVHGASPTASRWFVEHPAETIDTAISGTGNMLALAREKKAEGFVYLSSMEVYGTFREETLLSEDCLGYLNPLNIRSCYPEGKRLCECLCASYASEYGVPAAVVRLAQSFGPGVSRDDVRVFAEFARCALAGEDIVLQTPGGSKRCYVYTMDAVSGILTVLLNGRGGEAYNLSNPETYCSIWEMAAMVMERFGRGSSVRIAATEESVRKYPQETYWRLDSRKAESLGWKPLVGLPEMYGRMISTFS